MTSIIFLLGMSLVIVDSVSSGRLSVFMNGLTSSDLQHTLSQYQDSFVFIGSQIILVMFMSSAGKNRELGKIFVFLLLALWLVYAVKNPDGITKFFGILSGKIKPISASTTSTPSKKGVN